MNVDKNVVNITMSSIYVDIFELSLEELMNLKVKVASKIKLTQRESPGIITVITKDEIKHSGCRDMIDVLRLVPGIEFGIDVLGIASIIMRGNWAHEGKILLMIDGLEMNELSYSTIQFGNHIPVEQIERVEIIRGPGSAVYGGFAEMGVINIITKSAGDINGFSIGGTYGQMSKTYARRNANLSIGKKFNDNIAISLHSLAGQGNRSDRIYTDVYGNSYNMKDNAQLNPMLFNFNTQIYDLNFRFLYDDYKTTTRDAFDSNLLKGYRTDSKTIISEINYDYKVSDKLTITPKINYKYSRPYNAWENPLPDEDLVYTSSIVETRTVDRYTANLTAFYDINQKVNLLLGGEYFTDIAKKHSVIADKVYWNGKKQIQYNNMSFFAQALVKHRIINLTLGGRFERHSDFDAAFAPRIALTKVYNRLHFKLLLSKAFRSPGVENIDLNAGLNPNLRPDIEPEKLNIGEFEIGFKANNKMLFDINIFYMEIKDPIIYYIDQETGGEGYKNISQTGTKGAEFEYKFRDKWGYINFNFSYYDANGMNKVENYAVAKNNAILLGAPQIKANLFTNFKITKNLSLNPSATFLSERYAITIYDENIDDVVQEKIDPAIFLNLFVNYDNLLIKGLNLGIGVYDILDTKYDFIQPYNSWHAPYPGPSREFLVKLSYNLNL